MKDLSEINELLSGAENVVSKAFESLTEDVGLDQGTASDLLPLIGRYDTATRGQLRESFATRADFDREKSRLRRIIKAGRSKPRKGTVSIAPDNPNQLTSFYVDDYGNIERSQYANREESLLRSQENRRNMANLAKRGIRFVREDVLNPLTGRPIYDENRHKVTVMVPETPSMMERYREVIQAQPEKAVSRPDVPHDAIIRLWGDEVPVTGIERHRMSMRSMARAVEVDARTAAASQRYFDNYQTLVDTTMPTRISDEIDKYLGRVRSMSPQRQAEVYEFIQDNGDDVGTIEYLYWDTSSALPSKMRSIINFWRMRVAPMIGMEAQEEIELVEVEQDLGEFGYESNGLYPVFAEYQRRRKDEPKGKWRRDFRNAR